MKKTLFIAFIFLVSINTCCFAEIVINSEDIPLEEGSIFLFERSESLISPNGELFPTEKPIDSHIETIKKPEKIDGETYIPIGISMGLLNKTPYFIKKTPTEMIVRKTDSTLYGGFILSSQIYTDMKLFEFPLKIGKKWEVAEFQIEFRYELSWMKIIATVEAESTVYMPSLNELRNVLIINYQHYYFNSYTQTYQKNDNFSEIIIVAKGIGSLGGLISFYNTPEKGWANTYFLNLKDVYIPSKFDTDEDGIMDNIDECPNTPPNTNIDEKGCEILVITEKKVPTLNEWGIIILTFLMICSKLHNFTRSPGGSTSL